MKGQGGDPVLCAGSQLSTLPRIAASADSPPTPRAAVGCCRGMLLWCAVFRVQAQVRRMLCLLPATPTTSPASNRCSPGPGRLGSGASSAPHHWFEDMLKSILLCNCG